jgi:plastocyanin
VSQPKLGYLKGEISIEGSDGILANEANEVVIFIEGENLSSSHVYHQQSKTKKPPKISHLGRQFHPRILPIVRDTKVDFFNDDNIYHNVFSLSKAKPFDLGIYPENTSKLVRFEKTGLVKLYCNIHPGMTSNILVLNNDFYTIPDSNGNFSIKNIPIGHYSLRIWHELAETQQHNIEIKENENTLGKLSLKLTKRRIQHKNKFGKHYRSKY